MTAVLVEQQAVDRLAQLGLSTQQISRVVLRADAEAKMCNDLDPPIMEGMSRYGKTVRSLREELLPMGWTYDNAGNYCRTTHPSGEFAIVASSGDANTGIWVPGQNPTTKYPKGQTTARAIEVNDQIAFDLGEGFEADEIAPAAVKTWYLLYRISDSDIFVELSFPTGIEGGIIATWDERIILPPVTRHEPPSHEEGSADEDDHYAVDVARR
jgi:hypothetical protein